MSLTSAWEFVFSASVYDSGWRKDVLNQCLGVCVQIPRPTPNHPGRFGTASAPPPHDSASQLTRHLSVSRSLL